MSGNEKKIDTREEEQTGDTTIKKVSIAERIARLNGNDITKTFVPRGPDAYHGSSKSSSASPTAPTVTPSGPATPISSPHKPKAPTTESALPPSESTVSPGKPESPTITQPALEPSESGASISSPPPPKTTLTCVTSGRPVFDSDHKRRRPTARRKYAKKETTTTLSNPVLSSPRSDIAGEPSGTIPEPQVPHTPPTGPSHPAPSPATPDISTASTSSSSSHTNLPNATITRTTSSTRSSNRPPSNIELARIYKRYLSAFEFEIVQKTPDKQPSTIYDKHFLPAFSELQQEPSALNVLISTLQQAFLGYYRHVKDPTAEIRTINDAEVEEFYGFSFGGWLHQVRHNNDGVNRALALLCLMIAKVNGQRYVNTIEQAHIALRLFFNRDDVAFSAYSFTSYILDRFVDGMDSQTQFTKQEKYTRERAPAIINAFINHINAPPISTEVSGPEVSGAAASTSEPSPDAIPPQSSPSCLPSEVVLPEGSLPDNPHHDSTHDDILAKDHQQDDSASQTIKDSSLVEMPTSDVNDPLVADKVDATVSAATQHRDPSIPPSPEPAPQPLSTPQLTTSDTDSVSFEGSPPASPSSPTFDTPSLGISPQSPSFPMSPDIYATQEPLSTPSPRPAPTTPTLSSPLGTSSSTPPVAPPKPQRPVSMFVSPSLVPGQEPAALPSKPAPLPPPRPATSPLSSTGGQSTGSDASTSQKRFPSRPVPVPPPSSARPVSMYVPPTPTPKSDPLPSSHSQTTVTTPAATQTESLQSPHRDNSTSSAAPLSLGGPPKRPPPRPKSTQSPTDPAPSTSGSEQPADQEKTPLATPAARGQTPGRVAGLYSTRGRGVSQQQSPSPEQGPGSVRGTDAPPPRVVRGAGLSSRGARGIGAPSPRGGPDAALFLTRGTRGQPGRGQGDRQLLPAPTPDEVRQLPPLPGRDGPAG